MLEINQIYKIKEGHEEKCGVFKEYKGKFIKITEIDTSYSYDILDENKKYIGSCGICFTEDDLELEEEVKSINNNSISDCQSIVNKEKSLDNLEVGDMFISPYGEKHKISGIEDITFEVDNFETVLFTLKYLKKEGYKYYNPNAIKELSPSEAETLLEEKLGYKVKIK